MNANKPYCKKQIYKCSLYYAPDKSYYGISNGEGFFLLENGLIARDKTVENSNDPDSTFFYRSNYHDSGMPCVTAATTRNVPPEIRSVLENKYSDFVEFFKTRNALRETMAALEEIEKSLQNTKTDIDKASGILSKEEFVEAFIQNLSGDMQYDLKHQIEKDASGEIAGLWNIAVTPGHYGLLRIVRKLQVAKHVNEGDYDFLRHGYNGALSIETGGSKDYQTLLDKYCQKLDCSKVNTGSVEKLLVTGDMRLPEGSDTGISFYQDLYIDSRNNSLVYMENYQMFFGEKPLTAELAADLAYAFDDNLSLEDELELV